MAKTPIVFLRDIPNDDKGQDFIATLKKLYNKDRYRILVRGQKPADKKDWVKHSYGIPIAKSKTLRLYVFDKLKDEEMQDLQRRIWELQEELKDSLLKNARQKQEVQDELTDLRKTVVEQRQKILELTSTPVENREDNPVQTVCLRQYEIEITYCPIRTKYNYKIWDGENDRYVHEGINFLNTIDATVAEAKWEIEEREEKHYEYW